MGKHIPNRMPLFPQIPVSTLCSGKLFGDSVGLEFPIMTNPPASFPAWPVHYAVAAGLYAACLTHMLHTHTNVATAGEGGSDGASGEGEEGRGSGVTRRFSGEPRRRRPLKEEGESVEGRGGGSRGWTTSHRGF